MAKDAEPSPNRLDKCRLADLFGRRVQSYDQATPVQQGMAETLVRQAQARLAGLPVARILELGCGTGRMTRLLRQQFPAAVITAIDLSPQMVDFARNSTSDVTFIVADAESFVVDLPAHFDLVISNATAQWFEDAGTTLTRASKVLARRGLLAVSTFGERTFCELRTAFEQAYAATRMDPIQHLVPMRSLACWRQILADSEATADEIVSHFPSVIDFLHSIRAAGAVNSLAGSHFLSRRVLRAMLARYPVVQSEAGPPTVPATYQVIYLYCRAGANHDESNN
jgi:malonyl-CoA O-methyltransferase